MIINPIICPNCKRELQMNDCGVKINNLNHIVRICMFCSDEQDIEETK